MHHASRRAVLSGPASTPSTAIGLAAGSVFRRVDLSGAPVDVAGDERIDGGVLDPGDPADPGDFGASIASFPAGCP